MITISNLIGQDRRRYFGCKVDPSTDDLAKVRSLRHRWWNRDLGVWMVPYSRENWQLLQEKFVGDFSVDPLPRSIHLRPEPKKECKIKQANLSVSRQALLPHHEQALLRMKEQLIINRYQFATQKNYLSCFSEFLASHAEVRAGELSKEEIRQYLLYKIESRGISESTQNVIINAIKFYYEKVEKWEKFYIGDLRPRRPNQLPGFLGKEEVARLLLSVENEKHRIILTLIYSAGLRLGELIRLKIRDIRFDQDVIMVKCSKGKKDRVTMLSQRLKQEIKDYLDSYKPNYWLFEGQDGGQYSPRSVQNILKRAVYKSGVDENTTVHTLRHSFATHLVLNGVDLRRVQEYLGHSSLETTAIYTHITDKMIKSVQSPVDELDIWKK